MGKVIAESRARPKTEGRGGVVAFSVRSLPLVAQLGGFLFVCAVLLPMLSVPGHFGMGLVSVLSQDLLLLLLAATASSLPALHALHRQPLPRWAGIGTLLLWSGGLILQVHMLGLLMNAAGFVPLGTHFPALQGLGLLAFIAGLVFIGFPVMLRDLLSPESKALPLALAFIGFMALFSPVFELSRLLLILFGVGWFFLGTELRSVRRRLLSNGAAGDW